MIESGALHSILLWGPPGCGKTTLAALIAQAVDAVFVPISAVESGTSDIKAIIQSAKRRKIELPTESPHTILFIDEIHRFNKLQQDALLGAVEQGILTLIGATTENPGFSVIPALVSRCQTYRLHAHSESDMKTLITKACKYLELKAPGRDVVDFLTSYGSGDARKILNAIDIAAPLNTPILASASGKVIVSRSGGWNGGYGNYIVIKHDNGTQTLYAHNNENKVSVGDVVKKGDVIALMGSTGKATGIHLHFEVRGAKNPF
jgi:putative ATPase